MCTIAMIWLCVKRTLNVHKYIIQNIGISKFEKHVTTSQFRYETFYYLWVKGFDIKREAQSFYSGFFISSNTCGTRHKGLREQATTNRLPPRQVSSPLVRCPVSTHWLFQNLPKSSARFQCVTSLAMCNPVYYLGLLWHLCVTHPLCARAWTPVLMLQLTSPYAEPKGSQPN